MILAPYFSIRPRSCRENATPRGSVPRCVYTLVGDRRESCPIEEVRANEFSEPLPILAPARGVAPSARKFRNVVTRSRRRIHPACALSSSARTQSRSPRFYPEIFRHATANSVTYIVNCLCVYYKIVVNSASIVVIAERKMQHTVE